MNQPKKKDLQIFQERNFNRKIYITLKMRAYDIKHNIVNIACY